MTTSSRLSRICSLAASAGLLAAAVLGADFAPASAQTADSILANAKAARAAAICLNGYVWREAAYADLVCVVPAARTRAASENQLAASRRVGSGAYGPNTCKSGYVWREAFGGDQVCVPPASRDLARVENAQGPSHRVKR